MPAIAFGREILEGLRSASSSPADELQRYRLVASALAGRTVEVLPSESGSLAWTDGSSIFVDPDAAPVDRLRSVTVQASLLAAGSLDASLLGMLRRPRVAIRYLAVEAQRALVLQEAILPRTVRPLIVPQIAARTDSPAASLEIATGAEPVPEPPDVFGTIRARQIRSTFHEPGAASAGWHVPSRPATEALPELDDGGDDERASFDVFSSPVGGRGPIGRLLKRMFGDSRSAGGGPPGADSPTHWTRRAARSARGAATTTVIARVPDMVDVVDQQGATYPEWDVHRRRYRPNWCTVLEVEPGEDELAPLVAPDLHAYRRPLARLGLELERSRRQAQGDDIDIDAAVEARVDAIAGTMRDDGLYLDNVRRRRDLAVLILLDISGSAGEPSATGRNGARAPAGRRRGVDGRAPRLR